MSSLEQYLTEIRCVAERDPEDRPVPFEILVNLTDIAAAEAEAQARAQQRDWPEGCWTVGVVFEDQYVRVVRDAVRFSDGRLGTYIRILEPQPAPPAVAVLPLFDERIVLLRHFRHATRGWHVEIPRGFGEPGATAADSVARELKEEIGALPLRMLHLGDMHPDTGLFSRRVHISLAEIDGVRDFDAAEGVAGAILLRPSELSNLLAEGAVTDSFTLAAVAFARARGFLLNDRDPWPH